MRELSDNDKAIIKRVISSLPCCPNCGTTLDLATRAGAPQEDVRSLAFLAQNGFLKLYPAEEAVEKWIEGKISGVQAESQGS